MEMPLADDLGPTARAALEAYQTYFEADATARKARAEHSHLNRIVPPAERKAYNEALARLRRELRAGNR
jgi:hypothetical protein